MLSEFGLPEDQKNVIERILIKQSYSDNSNSRLNAMRTLAEMGTDKDEAALAIVRRLVDKEEEIRDESKRILRSLKGTLCLALVLWIVYIEFILRLYFIC